MRLIIGLLLAMLCISSGKATDKTAWLSSLAGVPIQLFELQAPDVSRKFRAFLANIPMTNDRPVPQALIDDTVASLRFMKSATPVSEPSYFVASYIHKTPLVAVPESSRERYLERYGESVYPQQVCPVFLDSANASAATLLSTASNLPPVYFEEVAGSAENFDRLFGLTEASHCGFIARELAQPTVLPPDIGQDELRMILEALGDYEAIAVFRDADYVPGRADEADVLYAARLLAMFLLERESPYNAIPGLLHEYQRIGIDAAHRRLDGISDSIKLARRTVEAVVEPLESASDGRPVPLAVLEAGLQQARQHGALAVDDDLARTLIADLKPALRLLQGDRTAVTVPRRPAAAAMSGGNPAHRQLITLTGARTFPN